MVRGLSARVTNMPLVSQCAEMARIVAGDAEALIDYAALDPEVALCFPEPEHFHPLLYVLGARQPGEPVEFVNDKVYSTISMTSVLIGA